MDDLKSVGTILREAREAKGITLLQAEEGTSIRKRYLEAIENDEYDKTPGGVFLKGIIRTYGNFLDLNGPELVVMFKASEAGVAAEKVCSEGIREVDKVKMNIQLKEKRDIGSGTGRFELPSFKLPLRQIAAGVGVLCILGVGYVAVPKIVSLAQSVSVPSSEPKQEQQIEQAPVAPVVTKPVVEMLANGDCWLEVRADGKDVFSGMLYAKDVKTFEAEEKLIIKYGNIGVMQIKVNGKPEDLKGEHGVAVKTYTKDS